jgi:hypothetical protein
MVGLSEEARQKILDSLFTDECKEGLQRLKDEFLPVTENKEE